MIPRLISTRTHGVLDYVTAGTLFALPRAFDWSANTRSLLTSAAVATVAYSALTRYEFGLVKVIPMRGHLAFDGLSGATLAAASIGLSESRRVTGVLFGLGLFEIVASLMSQPEPSRGGRLQQAKAALRFGGR